jgi:hypothetical protein
VQSALDKIGPAPRVAWTDYQGRVHIGSLDTLQQRVVASGAGGSLTLAVSGTTLLWTSGHAMVNHVMAYDTVTGHVRHFADGVRVFNAAGSSDIFVDPNNADSYQSLAKYGPSGQLIQRYTYPNGWYLPDQFALGPSSPALAGGQILVRSPIPGQGAATAPPKLGVWTPSTGGVGVLGQGYPVATFTNSRNEDSLVAWFPARCPSGNCPLNITDLGSGMTRTVRSPLHFGFTENAAFSPDGSQLAVFARTGPEGAANLLTLTLVDSATGSSRLVPAAPISVGYEVYAWVQWLPGSDQLIAGGLSGQDGKGVFHPNHFLVDSVTLRSTPFHFLTDGQQDVNYSAVVLP